MRSLRKNLRRTAAFPNVSKMDKQEIRAYIKAKRKAADEAWVRTVSCEILRRLCGLPQYLDAKTIYTYVGCRGEVDTISLIRRAAEDGKRVAVPKVLGDIMEFFYLEDPDTLEPGMMGIPEPDPERAEMAKEEDALMIMPGLAFAPDGARVGFGGGYYDKYLAAHPDLVKVALAFSYQIFDELPMEKLDIPVPVIVTEDRVIYTEE